LACIAGGFTAYYSIRALYVTFITTPCHSPYIKPKESGKSMLGSLTLLGVGAIFTGYVLKDVFIGPGSNYFRNTLILPGHSYAGDSEFIPLIIKMVPLG